MCLIHHRRPLAHQPPLREQPDELSQAHARHWEVRDTRCAGCASSSTTSTGALGARTCARAAYVRWGTLTHTGVNKKEAVMLLDNGKRRNHRIGGGSRPHPRGQKVKGSSRRGLRRTTLTSTVVEIWRTATTPSAGHGGPSFLLPW